MLFTDIVDWLLGPDGDISAGQDVIWTSGLAGVVQSCAIAVRMVRGEWFINDLEGVPYWERDGVPAADALLGQPFNALKAIAAYREALLNVPQTIAILKLDVSFDKSTGKLGVAWQVRTTFGDSPVITQLGG